MESSEIKNVLESPSERVGNTGLDFYLRKDFTNAEEAFRQESIIDSIGSINNLVYMIRRGESKASNTIENSKLIRMLQKGVAQKYPFSIVNMALLFALNISCEGDWEIADELIANIPKLEIGSVCSWWQDVAEAGDIEGLLVTLFLLRHRKIESSPLGPRLELATRLSMKIKDFPCWMREYATSK